MRVLVTGATGFVGRHLLAALPPRVTGVGLSRRGGPASEAVDILEAEAVRKVVATHRPDVVVHLAAVTQARGELRYLKRVNVEGAVNVAEAVWSAAPRARLVVASTGYVLGETGDRPADESAPRAPVGPYAGSKAAMEVQLEGLAGGRSLHILRPFNHTGPGQAPTHAVPAFARKVHQRSRTGGVLEVGDLTAVRDLSDVRDLAAVLVRMCTASSVPPLLHVCSGVGRPMEEVLDALIARAGLHPGDLRVERRGRSPLRRNVGDPSRCRRWMPEAPRPWAQTLDDVWAAVVAAEASV